MFRHPVLRSVNSLVPLSVRVALRSAYLETLYEWRYVRGRSPAYAVSTVEAHPPS